MLKHLVTSLGILACTTFGAQAAERFEITAGIFGGTQYQYCFALSEIIKAQAPQFELLPVETTGSPASLLKASQKPEKTIFAMSTTSFVDAIQGNRPYSAPVTNVKIIGFITQNIQTLITYADDIKTVADMSGKRFITTSVLSSSGRHFWNILKRAIPNSKDMKPTYANWTAVQNGLLDGTADVGALGVTTSASGPWMPIPAYAEIVASRGAPHFISVDEKYIREAAEAEKMLYIPVLMPKGSIAENVPAQDIMAWEERLGIGGFEETPDELAYTIAKLLCEQAEAFTKFTPVGKAMSVSVTVPSKEFFRDEDIHPGALRYYKEKGLR